MQKLKSITGWILIGGLLINNLPAVAQHNPPTGGPNPPPETTKGTSVLVYSLAGAAIAGVTYYVVKKYPRRLPATERLDAYLAERNILPSADAYHLMYALNPSLQGKSRVRANRKLVEPDFPPVPATLLNSMLPVPLHVPALSQELRLLQAHLGAFPRARVAMPADGPSPDQLVADLKALAGQLSFYAEKQEDKGPVKVRLLTGLLQALNQTLARSISTRVLTRPDATLLQQIRENAGELLAPVAGTTGSRQSFQSEARVYAARDSRVAWAPTNSTWLPPGLPAESALEKSFAFAIYKIKEDGTVIAKGPEVEGQYFIQYVCPALKNYKNFYQNISPPPATYAAAKLPPARFYLLVKDLLGREVPLQNAMIDTRILYKNPRRKEVDQMILVTVYVKP